MIRGRAPNNLKFARRSEDGLRGEMTAAVLNKDCLKIHTPQQASADGPPRLIFEARNCVKLVAPSSKYVSSTDPCSSTRSSFEEIALMVGKMTPQSCTSMRFPTVTPLRLNPRWNPSADVIQLSPMTQHKSAILFPWQSRGGYSNSIGTALKSTLVSERDDLHSGL